MSSKQISWCKPICKKYQTSKFGNGTPSDYKQISTTINQKITKK